MNYRISHHAREEMERRSISDALLDKVLNDSQQVVVERENLKAYQSQIDFGGGRFFLLRVIVDDTVEPAVVVTAYRTGKIVKYWRVL